MSFQRLVSLPCELRTLFYRTIMTAPQQQQRLSAASESWSTTTSESWQASASYFQNLTLLECPRAQAGVSLAAPSSSHFEQDTSYPEALAIAGLLICDIWAHDSSCNGARQAWHAHSCLYFIKVHMAGAAQPRKRSSRIKMPELKLPNVTRPSRG